ncbi:hypothetical protein HOLleu_17465 [Holothuria leucospilota]|uniref:Uncharacterized protein n=1 Tax=Holothuria leucospilota TaxID=206669 RepID=A0A9Q1H609_HOLLE|nr:hypothetical protein HOLleu_17465 [Holothuria leucospilota]
MTLVRLYSTMRDLCHSLQDVVSVLESQSLKLNYFCCFHGSFNISNSKKHLAWRTSATLRGTHWLLPTCPNHTKSSLRNASHK